MIDAQKLRAWYAHRQGLDGSLDDKSSAEEVLDRAGWARSVGGVSPYLTLFSRAGITREQINGWILHAGGRDVLIALEEHLRIPPEALRHSRDALRRYGNLSSAFVYFVLDAALADDAPGGWWWMSSFGAGFTCHGALLSVE